MRSGPCLCGDTACPSCGPAQGHCHCHYCGADMEEGCPDPNKCNAAEAEETEAYAAQESSGSTWEKVYDDSWIFDDFNDHDIPM